MNRLPPPGTHVTAWGDYEPADPLARRDWTHGQYGEGVVIGASEAVLHAVAVRLDSGDLVHCAADQLEIVDGG